ncbi:hypothetical protein Anas_10735 [Armadillidium nasatum]|uniref:Uncharacterized protein n=1 Tax=Armadillidium nasatum TaxID=96803 RepID=A0A5N5T5B5_9CRUS|nr:hypothetical protein Anas_10735 [Armadillidium nasatum]
MSNLNDEELFRALGIVVVELCTFIHINRAITFEEARQFITTLSATTSLSVDLIAHAILVVNENFEEFESLVADFIQRFRNEGEVSRGSENREYAQIPMDSTAVELDLPQSLQSQSQASSSQINLSQIDASSSPNLLYNNVQEYECNVSINTLNLSEDKNNNVNVTSNLNDRKVEEHCECSQVASVTGVSEEASDYLNVQINFNNQMLENK